MPGLVDKIIAKHGIEAVLVEYVFLSKALCGLPASIRKVIDTHDLFQDREEKIPETTPIPWPWCLANLRMSDEIAALRRADTVLAIQAEEGAELSEAGCRNVEVVPYLDVRSSCSAAREVPCEEPFTLAFFGSDWAPNVHGVQWFIREVLPLLREVDERIQLRLFGTIADAISATPNVEKIGFVDDIERELKCCGATVIPVFYGTGMNLKLVEALGWGLPVVATVHAFRGLGDGIKQSLSASDDVQLLSDGILRLLLNKQERLERCRMARACYEEICERAEEALRRSFPTIRA